MGSIPSQGVYKRQLINVSLAHQCLSTCLSVCLSPPTSLSLKAIKTHPQVRFFKKRSKVALLSKQWSCYSKTVLKTKHKFVTTDHVKGPEMICLLSTSLPPCPPHLLTSQEPSHLRAFALAVFGVLSEQPAVCCLAASPLCISA